MFKPTKNQSEVLEILDKNIAVIDVGTKKNIIRCLLNRGCNVTVYPCDFDADEVIASKPDGIMITNGPGDPAECVSIIEEIRKLSQSGIPIFPAAQRDCGCPSYPRCRCPPPPGRRAGRRRCWPVRQRQIALKRPPGRNCYR